MWGPDTLRGRRFASGDTITTIPMRAPLTASMGRTGSRTASSLVQDRGITDITAVVGTVARDLWDADMPGLAGATVTPATCMADMLVADMRMATRVEGSTVELQSMAGAADFTAEAVSTVADTGNLR